MEKPILKFWWEWQAQSPFWPANETALELFGYGEVAFEKLALPTFLVEALINAAEWHDTSLNWNYPPDPGPWRQLECDQFNVRSQELFKQCSALLDPTITLLYEHRLVREDPDLDRYLADPKQFLRI